MSNRRRSGCLIAVAVALLLTGWLSWKAFRVARSAQSLLNQQARVELLLADGPLKADPDAAAEVVATAQRDVAVIYGETRPFFWLLRRLAWMPRLGPLLAESPALLEMADSGARLAQMLTPVWQPALRILQTPELHDSELAAVAQLLAANRATLEAAQPQAARLSAAHAALGRRDELPWTLNRLLTRADPYLPLAEDGLRFVALLPDLLGVGGERFYLILAQNEDELRATGGFISGVGRLLVRDGDIALLDFVSGDDINANLLQQSEAYDYPPEPLVRFMGLDYFVLRDANFWPDFPTSAETAVRLFQLGQPDSPPVDGVIAFDQRFVQLTIEALGALDIPDLEMRVNAANVIPRMRESWGAGLEEGESTGAWWVERKSFMGSMALAIQERLFRDPGSVDFPKLLNAVVNGAATNHLQIFLRDPQTAAIVDGLGWNGRFAPPANQDFFLALDTNTGFNKVNAVVERALAYNVTLSESGLHQATVTLGYRHGGPVDDAPCNHLTPYNQAGLSYDVLIQTCYYNYVRLYAPPGSRLIEAAAHNAPANWFITGRAWGPGWLTGLSAEGGDYPLAETLRATYDPAYAAGSAGVWTAQDGSAVFDNFFVLPRGGELQTHFTYTLPPGVVQTRADGSHSYQLRVLGQAGAGDQALTVAVTLPPSAVSVQTTPAEATIDGRTVTFSLRLEADVDLQVTYR